MPGCRGASSGSRGGGGTVGARGSGSRAGGGGGSLGPIPYGGGVAGNTEHGTIYIYIYRSSCQGHLGMSFNWGPFGAHHLNGDSCHVHYFFHIEGSSP